MELIQIWNSDQSLELILNHIPTAEDLYQFFYADFTNNME
jgi:hypothetical protein